ncbi:hypothetical protein [Arsenicibacter rosenii]|uniref:Uncharacterized protein n=1 Tax=Arsenicibacter rosenii TaxID=1750698 RepID=A0A1S2VDI8_9BACT|nr:hypothetical protein [Arsenicibacter rosenii]OIN56837.1 hypothetical protein BLX24_22965 [Arsenicibacter rosenii]
MLLKRTSTYVLGGLAAFLTACAVPKSFVAELQPRSVKAIDTEETFSRGDEILLAYSLTAFDAQNKPTAVVSGGWGVASIRQGQQIKLQPVAKTVGEKPAAPVSLTMPRNGRIMASVVLIEVDDLSEAQDMLTKIRKVHNVVSTPAAILITATEILTPLKYVAAGLTAAGIGMQLADHLDNDDLLGQSNVEIKEADLKKDSAKRFIHVPARFKGENMRDSYDYELEYDVLLKTVKVR